MPKVLMQFFQSNINELKNINPDLVARLESIKEVQDFEIFMDNDDVNTLNFIHKKHFTPLYETSALQTIQEQIQEYQIFAKHPYLYFYGIANGVFIKNLLQNEIHNRIMVIEPEIEILYVVLHLIDFSQEIKDSRLVILGYEDIEFAYVIPYFLSFQEHKYARTYSLNPNTNYYDKHFFEHMQHTNRIIIEALYHSVNVAGNDTTDALIGLKHHIVNLAKVIETPPLFELLNKLHTCHTAVLVSTGPSLSKQLPLLKKIAPYVRIIAVDASFPVLYNAGIKPDVVVSMERVPASAKFFTDTPAEAFDDVVFALTSVQHKNVVDSIKGGTMQISLRPLGIMLYTGPEHWGYLGIGQSAANMAYEMIYHSKFNNCILIGQDLAFGEDGSSHAGGHVFGRENVKTKDEDVWIKGWQNKKEVRTNHTWDLFRKSFEKDIAETKATMLTINATEGGASIYGSLEITFADAINKYVDQTNQKNKLTLLKATQSERDKITKQTWQKVDAMRDYVDALLQESKALFLDVAAKCEEDANPTSNEIKALIKRAENIKNRHNEEIYDKIVWHISQTTMLSKEIDLAPAEVYIAKSVEEEKDRLTHLMQAYKPWLFMFAGILDATLKTIDYAKARQLIDKVKKIDVYIKDKKIDTITCHDTKAENSRVFDVDMRGILYDAQKYQKKIDEIVFKNNENNKELPRNFVDVITKDDEKYNELSFMKSLEEPIDEKLKDMYCPNAIGFLATEENLEDVEFVGYIKELMERFPDIEFKAFMIKGKDKNKDISSLMKKLKIIYISNISDIIFNSMLYIHNGSNISKANILIKLIGNMPFIYYSKDDFIMSLEQNELKYENEILQAYGIDITEKSFYKDYLGFISSSISKKMLRKDFSFCYIDAALNSLEIRNKLIEMKL